MPKRGELKAEAGAAPVLDSARDGLAFDLEPEAQGVQTRRLDLTWSYLAVEIPMDLRGGKGVAS